MIPPNYYAERLFELDEIDLLLRACGARRTHVMLTEILGIGMRILGVRNGQ